MSLYSHDTVGLGHLRRNLAIAEALVAQPDPPDVLVICSTPTSGWEVPHGVDFLVLPAVKKHDDGRYGPRRLRSDLSDLVHLRTATIDAALQAFRPDLLIVDKVPGGLFGELETTLARLDHTGATRTVLGLRDILDEPAATRREWAGAGTAAYVASRYDEVWVYGDVRVHDLAGDLGLRALQGVRTMSMGYVARPAAAPVADPSYDLCLLGGGQDGRGLAEAFLGASGPAPKVLVTGPQMPAQDQRDLVVLAAEGDAEVHRFVPGVAGLIAGARRVVAMAGYNTTVELLSSGRPSLLVPRTRPRQEQLARADRLARLGLVDVIRPEHADEHALTTWLRADLSARPAPGDVIDLDGLDHIVERTTALFGATPAPADRVAADVTAHPLAARTSVPLPTPAHRELLRAS